MDADRRHELHQNELAAALERGRDLLNDRRVGYVAIVLIALAAIYFIGRWRSVQQEQARRANWEAIWNMNISAADPAAAQTMLQTLNSLADGAPDPGARAAAMLRRADLLKQVARNTFNPEDFQKALGAYQLLSEDGGAPAMLRAAALFNVGQMRENLFDAEGARRAYVKLRDDAQFEGQLFRDLAVTRLETLPAVLIPLQLEDGFPMVDLSPAPPVEAPLEPAPAPEEPVSDEPAVDEPADPVDEPVDDPIDEPAASDPEPAPVDPAPQPESARSS